MLYEVYKPIHSRKFVTASSQYLRVASAVTSALPLTMACWFNKVEANALRTLMSVGHSSTANSWHRLQADVSVISVQSRTASGTATGSTTAAYRASQWHHACGVFASATSRIPYLDGEPGTENTTSRAPTFNTTLIGAGEDGGTLSSYHNGFIAWPAFWSTALTKDDVRRLANGVHPTRIHPESLVAFWDWTGAETEFGWRSASFPLINTGTAPVSVPIPLKYRSGRRWGVTLGTSASSVTTVNFIPNSIGEDQSSGSILGTGALTALNLAEEIILGTTTKGIGVMVGSSLEEEINVSAFTGIGTIVGSNRSEDFSSTTIVGLGVMVGTSLSEESIHSSLSGIGTLTGSNLQEDLSTEAIQATGFLTAFNLSEEYTRTSISGIAPIIVNPIPYGFSELLASTSILGITSISTIGIEEHLGYGAVTIFVPPPPSATCGSIEAGPRYNGTVSPAARYNATVKVEVCCHE